MTGHVAAADNPFLRLILCCISHSVFCVDFPTGCLVCGSGMELCQFRRIFLIFSMAITASFYANNFMGRPEMKLLLSVSLKPCT